MGSLGSGKGRGCVLGKFHLVSPAAGGVRRTRLWVEEGKRPSGWAATAAD